MSALHATQVAFAGWLLHGDAAFAGHVAGDQASERLRVYRDAYRLRLCEVLANDFPATRATLGAHAFDMLARRYLRAHPSRSPSVRHFGAHVADWLRSQADAPAGLHELARFEWLQGECFDAVDTETLHIDEIATLAADAWPALMLRLRPCVRLLDTRLLGLRDGRPALADEADPAHWLLWRGGDHDVHWRLCDEDEADALRHARDGCRFDALCERLSVHHGNAGALRAASLLKRWLADGLLAAIPPQP